MTKFQKWITGLMAVASGCVAATAHAQEVDTLKKIKDAGVIVLGVRQSSVPFSYEDNKQNIIGYSHEIEMKIVDAVKAKLGMPDLKVRLMPMTSQNKIPLILNGAADIECNNTTNNEQREKIVGFSNTFFIIGTRLMTTKNSGIKDFSDLKGKTVVTEAGATSEQILGRMNQEKQMGMTIVTQKNVADAFLVLETGRADAYMLDDALLAGARANSSDPGKYVIVGTPQSKEAYGCMMRKGDTAFKALVDATIAKMQTSGEATALYKKWFQTPIPPNGINMDFPENSDMQALFKAPNDKPL